MKKINRKYLVNAYADQFFDYLVSDYHMKHRYVIRFFKGVKRTFEGFGLSDLFYDILVESSKVALSRLSRPYEYYKSDVDFVLEFFS